MRLILALVLAISMFMPISTHAEDASTSRMMLDVELPRFSSVAVAFAEGEEATSMPAQSLAQGTWTAQLFLSGTYGFDDGDLYLLHAGVGYHIADAVSVNLDFVGGYTFEDELGVDPNLSIGFDLYLRWHLLHGDGWSFFVEGGCGMIWFSDEFPSGGTHQNFTPQLGAGFTCKIIGEARLLVGVRWHHISNAGKSGKDSNPGFDGIMPYAGLIIPF